MSYNPAQSFIGAGTNPYDVRGYGQFDNVAYDNSAYADYSNFNQITPFNAWTRKNITGYGAPPPGMGMLEYRDRIDELAGRFSSGGAISALNFAPPVLSTFANASFFFPETTRALLNASGFGGAAGLTGALGSLSSAVSSVTGAMLSPAMVAGDYFVGAPISSLMSGAFGIVDDLGAKFGINSMGTGAATGVKNLLTKVPFGIGSWLESSLANPAFGASAGKLGSLTGFLASGAVKAPIALAGMTGSFMATSALIDTGIGAIMNSSGLIISQEEGEISDTFRALSDRVLAGSSEFKSKSFAKDIAREIKTRAMDDYRARGVIGTLADAVGIRDTGWAGRLFTGWSVLENMRDETAKYVLMASSNLVGKSNSADEFIKKADAMYSAIAKLGEALGQTTTKAMETATVLKSQGLSSPSAIGSAGSTIGTTSIMSGYSTNQVLAITGEATEAFRGTIYGANMGFNMANNVIRQMSLGESIIGTDAYADLMYTLRGKDSANVFGVRAMSNITNSREFKAMLIGSMFKKTDRGFDFTGNIDSNAIINAASGNFLSNESLLADLNNTFASMSGEARREAEVRMSEFTRNMSFGDIKRVFSAVSKMRGYSSDTEAYENIFRGYGLDPMAANNMAKIFGADTGYQQGLFSFFNEQKRSLDSYISGEDYKSSFGKYFFDVSGIAKGYTPLVEAAGMTGSLAGLGAALNPYVAIAGGVIGLGAAAYSNREYLSSIGGGDALIGAGVYGAKTLMPAAAVLGIGKLASSEFLASVATSRSMALLASGQTSNAIGLSGYARAGAQAIGRIVAPITSMFVGGELGNYAGEYAGEYVGKTGWSDWSKAADVAASIGVGAGTGAASTWLLSSILAGTTMPFLAPVVGAGAILAGGYALYNSLERNYLSDEARYGDIKSALDDSMALSMGVSRLRQTNLGAYNTLLSSDYLKNSKYIDRQKDIVSAASDIDKDPVLSQDLISTARRLTISSVTGEADILGYDKRFGSIVQDLSAAGGKVDLSDKLGNKFKELRYAMNYMPRSVQNKILGQLRGAGLDTTKFSGSGGTTLFTGDEFFKNSYDSVLAKDLKEVAERQKSGIESINKILKSDFSVSDPEGNKYINASNAADVYGFLIDMEGGVSDGDIAKRLYGNDKLQSLWAVLSEKPDKISGLRKAVGDFLSTSDVGVIGASIETLLKSKSDVLGGKSLDVTREYLNYTLLSGGKSELSDSTRKAKADGFKDVNDPSVKRALVNISAAEDYVRGFMQHKSAEELRPLIGKMDYATREAVKSQLENLKPGKEFGVMADISRQVYMSMSESMKAMTAEQLAQKNNAILDKLATAIETLNAKLGPPGSPPVLHGPTKGVNGVDPAETPQDTARRKPRPT